MKPIKLYMQYIGPYEKETIDFTHLNDSLFLIAGKTGSGKSMIFDAVTYALYSTSSTEARGRESLRSQFAPDNTPSKVILDFIHREKEYRVERTLTYRKRTNKTDTVGEATIYDSKGNILETGLNFVSKYVEMMLQMDAKQFRQIALLPQGEFKKLLIADTSEKEEILKTLFGTERFRKVYESINEKKKEKQKEKDISYQLLKNRFSQVLESDSEDFKQSLYFLELKIKERTEKINEKNTELTPIKAQVKKISEQLNEAKHHNKTLKNYFDNEESLAFHLKKENFIKEQEQTLKILESLESKRELFNLEKETKNQLDIKNKQLKQLKEENTENDRQLNEIRDILTNLKHQERDIDKKRQLIELYSKYDTEEYRTLNHNLKQKDKELETLKQSIDNSTNEYLKKQKEFNKINVTEQGLDELNNEINNEKITYNNLSNELNNTLQDEKNINRLNQLIEKKENFINQLKRVESDIHAIVEKYGSDTLETSESIRHLLNHLVIGEECPVCQNTVTKIPNSASVMDEATKKKLQKLYEEQQQFKNNIEKVGLEINILKENKIEINKSSSEIKSEYEAVYKKIEELKNSISIFKDQLKEKADLETQLNTINDDLKTQKTELKYELETKQRLEKQYESFKNDTQFSSFDSMKEAIIQYKKDDQTYIETLEKNQLSKQQLEIEQTKLIGQIEFTTTTITNLSSDLKLYQPRVEKFLKDYGFSSRDDVEAYLTLDKTSVANEVNSYYEQKNHLETILNELQNSLSTKSYVDIDTLESRYNDLNVKEKKVENTISELNFKLENDKQFFNTLTKEVADYEEQSKEQEQLAFLTEALNGGPQHPTLSRFVLIHYLEKILMHANIRLGEMTRGRYELLRKDTFKGADTLKIDVFDHFNNERRNVSTLSGGESFQASLALSLSLSEVIQHEAGSIEMDMLLIDEGFGTLDEETLNVAIETLIDLQSSGKMIGIISHVEELKHRISNIIHVHAENEQSTTQILTYLS